MSQFLQLLFQGFSLGCIYALVALGFTVIYRASKVINFAQGSLLLVDAYLVSVLATGLNLPFALAVLAAIALLAAGGVLFQTVVLRRVLGQPVFTLVMITIGLSIVIDSAVPAIFGPTTRILGDPWGASAVHLGGVTLNWVRIWAIVCTVVILALFFVFDRFSRYGLAMRATAVDEEAAMASVYRWRVSTPSPGRSPVGGRDRRLFLAGFPERSEPFPGRRGAAGVPGDHPRWSRLATGRGGGGRRDRHRRGPDLRVRRPAGWAPTSRTSLRTS